jgi:hypothetical protein
MALLMLTMLVLLPSCNEWLGIEPENDLIEDEFWTKTEDVEGVLAATYDAFRGTAMDDLIWGELRADMMTVKNVPALADYYRIAKSDITTTNSKVNWSGYYKTINLANTLIYYSDQVMEKDKTFTQEIRNAMEAEALFLRSLSYFYLVRVWKDVPLTLSPTISDTVNIFKAKSSEYEVIAQIESDLIRARDMAYTTKFSDNPEYYKGKANRYSIIALMADIYLWNEKYQQCIDACNEIINSGLFSLEEYSSWFYQYYPGNSMRESIFEIQYSSIYTGQENPIYNDLVTLGSGAGNFIPTENMKRIFQITTDIRKCNAKKDPVPQNKYVAKDITTGIKRVTTEKDANFIYYRYAEILLFKAEALAELGQIQEANDILQVIAQRAGVPYTFILDKKQLQLYILEERAREFAAEGKRWFDVLRYGKRDNFKNKQYIINMVLGNAGIQERQVLQTKVYDTLSYYLPIPEKEVIYNQNLIQNPFYDR